MLCVEYFELELTTYWVVWSLPIGGSPCASFVKLNYGFTESVITVHPYVKVEPPKLYNDLEFKGKGKRFYQSWV